MFAFRAFAFRAYAFTANALAGGGAAPPPSNVDDGSLPIFIHRRRGRPFGLFRR